MSTTEAAPVIEGVVLNGGEQTVDGVTTGFLYGQDADPAYIAALHPDTVVHLPYEQLSIEAGFNARNFNTVANKEHVEDTAGSIAVQGVLTPVLVRVEGNRIIVVDGEVRTRATYRANEKGHSVPTVPVLLTSDASLEARTEAQITKNSGLRFTMPEQVTIVQRLLSFGYTKPQVLDRLGFSRTAFSKLMILAEAPPDVFELASTGRISPSAVVNHMIANREATPEEISKTLNKAVKKAEKDAEQAMAEGKTALKGAATQAKASDIAAVQDEEDVKTPVYSKLTFVGGLKLMQHIYNVLGEKKVNDATREELRSGIRNYTESINVNIEEPLPEARTPLTDEEKAERERQKEAEKAEKAAEKAKIDEARARAKKIKEDAEAAAKAELAAAGYVAPVRKPKAEGEAEAPAEATPAS